jgi:hypothetical protein
VLLDAWAGDQDRAVTDARLAEVWRLLEDEQLRDRGVFVERWRVPITTDVFARLRPAV